MLLREKKRVKRRRRRASAKRAPTCRYDTQHNRYIPTSRVPRPPTPQIWPVHTKIQNPALMFPIAAQGRQSRLTPHHRHVRCASSFPVLPPHPPPPKKNTSMTRTGLAYKYSANSMALLPRDLCMLHLLVPALATTTNPVRGTTEARTYFGFHFGFHSRQAQQSHSVEVIKTSRIPNKASEARERELFWRYTAVQFTSGTTIPWGEGGGLTQRHKAGGAQSNLASLVNFYKCAVIKFLRPMSPTSTTSPHLNSTANMFTDIVNIFLCRQHAPAKYSPTQTQGGRGKSHRISPLSARSPSGNIGLKEQNGAPRNAVRA